MKWKAESELAKDLGVTRLVVTNMRRLHLGPKEWKKDKAQGRKIVISEGGVKRLLEILSVRKSEIPPAATEAATPTQSLSEPKHLVLTTAKILMNPYMLDATDPHGKLWRVRVPSNLLYSVGDKLFAIESSSDPGILLQVGIKPKHRGDNYYRHQIVQEMGRL